MTRNRPKVFSPLIRPDRTLDVAYHQRRNAKKLIQNKSCPRGSRMNDSNYSLSNSRVLNPVEAIVQKAISNYPVGQLEDVKFQNEGISMKRSRMQPELRIKSFSPFRKPESGISESSSITRCYQLDHKFSENEISIFNNDLIKLLGEKAYNNSMNQKCKTPFSENRKCEHWVSNRSSCAIGIQRLAHAFAGASARCFVRFVRGDAGPISSRD